MKCKCCGAAVTMEEEFCPYCGALNEPARAHIEAMRRYQYDYQNTRQQVLRNANQQSRRHAQIIAVVILVAMNIILVALYMNIFLFQELFEEWKIKRHESEYQSQLEAYEAAGDYARLNALYSHSNLYSNKSLREYDAVADLADQYTRIQSQLFYLATDVDSYQTDSELLQRMSQNIQSFYEWLGKKDSYYYPERFSGSHLEAMEDMDRKLQAQLISFCGLTEEETAQLAQMDVQEIFLLLGRRTGLFE